MNLRAALAALACGLLLALAAPGTHAQAGDAVVAHDLLWMEAVAAVLALAAAAPDVDTVRPEPLKAPQARLEHAVVRLINSPPPPERLAGHVTLLPCIQELAAAARAVVEAADPADLAAGRAWLDTALVQLANASQRVAAAPR